MPGSYRLLAKWGWAMLNWVKYRLKFAKKKGF